ncbi:hypothetical protein GQR58_011217 [Nymphon striatum]|nr:hypothetical protein GQR58_011217 [Nymphon striatum]
MSPTSPTNLESYTKVTRRKRRRNKRCQRKRGRSGGSKKLKLLFWNVHGRNSFENNYCNDRLLDKFSSNFLCETWLRSPSPLLKYKEIFFNEAKKAHFGRPSSGMKFYTNHALKMQQKSKTFYHLALSLLVPGTEKYFPFVFVGDETFPLKENLLRPYPGRSLNHDRRICYLIHSLLHRYLASGNSQASICFEYRCGRSTVSTIIRETNKAICDALQSRYLQRPNADEWQSIAKFFDDR